MDKETKIMWAIVAVVVVVMLVIFSARADAAGFREQRAWQFMDPFQKSAIIQRESLRRLSKGGYFEGSHANKQIYIGEVNVDDVSGSLHYQTNVTVGNQTTIVQEGDGTLTYEGTQGGNDQGSSNTSQGNVVGAQNATDITQNGSQTKTQDWVLNGGS